MELNQVFQEIQANDGWGCSFKQYAPRFIEYAKNKIPIASWESEYRNQFLASDNCVSSLKQGNFTHEQRKAIVEAIKYVDEVVPQTTMDKTEFLKSRHFDVTRTI